MKRDCPICQSDKYLPVYCDIVQCLNCGMSYRMGVKEQWALDIYYKEMSKYELEPGTELDKHFKEHAEKVFDFIKDDIYLKDLNILDIGCSNGYFLDVVKQNSKDCYLHGIDPSKKCAAEVFNKGINSTQATIDSFKPDRNYNLICLSAVLEHLANPKQVIKKISSIQDINDKLVIVVPNLNLFSSFIGVPFQQLNSEHINYFRLKDIENLLTFYGYRITNYESPITKRTDFIYEPDLFILADKQGNIFDYVKESKKEEDKILKNLNHKLKDIDNIIVWGAGECSKWLFNSDPKLIDKVSYFVDNDTRLTTIGKYNDWKEIYFFQRQIVSPDQITESLPVLISSMAHADEIEKQIKDMGLTNEVITL